MIETVLPDDLYSLFGLLDFCKMNQQMEYDGGVLLRDILDFIAGFI